MSQILLVDDCSDLLNILKWSLQRNGYSCSTAYYREGLFYSISKKTPSLIIMDVDLNGDDGRHICAEIKNNIDTSMIPVMLCSGKHDLAHSFKHALADDFIQKPFEMENIIRKINLLLPAKPAFAS